MSQGFDEVRENLRDAQSQATEAAHRLEALMTRRMQNVRRRSEAVSCRLSTARLGARVAAARNRFSLLSAARDAAARSCLEDARARMAVSAASLDALSPLAVLTRGYALAQDEQGRLLRDARTVRVGDGVRLRLSEGALRCRVEETENP